MTDATITPPRTALTYAQAAAFLQAMAERNDDDTAPWPACMTCAVAPAEIGFPETDGPLLLDFPCGHLFAVAEDVQAAVFEGRGLPGDTRD